MRASTVLARALAALVATGALAAPAAAQDGIVTVRESAFNELAGALEPLTLSGHKTLEVSIATFWGPVRITVCDSDWTATVRDLAFDIRPATVEVTGDVEASWCGLNFTGDLLTTGDVGYSAGPNAVVVSVASTSVQPRFSIFGIDVRLPAINVGPTLSLPPIPVRTAFVRFETAAGPTDLRVTPHNVFLTKRNGFIELRSDVAVW